MQFHPRDGELVGQRSQLVELLGGRWCVTVDGVQHGGNRDDAGAGDLTFATPEEAAAYARQVEGLEKSPARP